MFSSSDEMPCRNACWSVMLANNDVYCESIGSRIWIDFRNVRLEKIGWGAMG